MSEVNTLREWARTVAITMTPLTADVAQKAAEFFADGGLGWNGLVAYVRHTHTNYTELLRQMPAERGFTAAYWIIKRRVNALVREALDQLLGQVKR